MRRLAVLTAAALAGCAPAAYEPGEWRSTSWMGTELPAAVYLEPAADGAAWSPYQVSRGLDIVCAATDGVWCPTATLDQNESNIVVRLRAPKKGFVGYSYAHRPAYGDGLVLIRPDQMAKCGGAILAHELLHLSGLEHNDDEPESLMAPRLRCSALPTENDTLRWLEYQGLEPVDDDSAQGDR